MSFAGVRDVANCNIPVDSYIIVGVNNWSAVNRGHGIGSGGTLGFLGVERWIGTDSLTNGTFVIKLLMFRTLNAIVKP